MSPEVKNRKLEKLVRYLADLKRHEDANFEVFMKNHYEVERLLELLNEVSSDLIFHELAKKNRTPDSYRAAFLDAGEQSILSKSLAKNLALAAGMRNILLHEYEEIDYQLVHRAIKSAICDYGRLLKEMHEK